MSKARHWYPNGAGTRFTLAMVVVLAFVVAALRSNEVAMLERAAFLALGFYFGVKAAGGMNGTDRLPDPPA